MLPTNKQLYSCIERLITPRETSKSDIPESTGNHICTTLLIFLVTAQMVGRL